MQVEQTMAHADHQLHEEAADEEMVSRRFDFKQSFCMMLSTAHSHFLHLTGVTFSNTWSFAGAWNCSEWYSKAPNCRVPYGRIGKSFQRCIRTCLFHSCVDAFWKWWSTKWNTNKALIKTKRLPMLRQENYPMSREFPKPKSQNSKRLSSRWSLWISKLRPMHWRIESK